MPYVLDVNPRVLLTLACLMREKRNDQKKHTPFPVCRMEGPYTTRGHWHAAATTTVHASYVVLKKRSGVSWLVP